MSRLKAIRDSLRPTVPSGCWGEALGWIAIVLSIVGSFAVIGMYLRSNDAANVIAAESRDRLAIELRRADDERDAQRARLEEVEERVRSARRHIDGALERIEGKVDKLLDGREDRP